jgi:hypothetical protein
MIVVGVRSTDKQDPNGIAEIDQVGKQVPVRERAQCSVLESVQRELQGDGGPVRYSALAVVAAVGKLHVFAALVSVIVSHIYSDALPPLPLLFRACANANVNELAGVLFAK